MRRTSRSRWLLPFSPQQPAGESASETERFAKADELELSLLLLELVSETSLELESLASGSDPSGSVVDGSEVSGEVVDVEVGSVELVLDPSELVDVLASSVLVSVELDAEVVSEELDEEAVAEGVGVGEGAGGSVVVDGHEADGPRLPTDCGEPASLAAGSSAIRPSSIVIPVIGVSGTALVWVVDELLAATPSPARPSPDPWAAAAEADSPVSIHVRCGPTIATMARAATPATAPAPTTAEPRRPSRRCRAGPPDRSPTSPPGWVPASDSAMTTAWRPVGRGASATGRGSDLASC